MLLVLAMLLVQGAARADMITVAYTGQTGSSQAYVKMYVKGVNLDYASSSTDNYTLNSLTAYITLTDSGAAAVDTTGATWTNHAVVLSGSSGSYTYSIPVSLFAAGKTLKFTQVSVYGNYAYKTGVTRDNFLFSTSGLSLSYVINSLGTKFNKSQLVINLTGGFGPLK